MGGTTWELKNLVEGRNYKFLVRAVNDEGDSPDLETEDFVTAKNEFDVPTPPGKPKASNWGPDWAEVTWMAPECDGGAEIKEYKLEMRDADKRAWNAIARCKETTFQAEKCGIELDHDYVFRVTAYNAGGESETSETSTPITAMERLVWDRRMPMLEMRPSPREVSSPSSTLLSTESSPTGMIWRRSGTTPSTMSSVLPLRNSLSSSLRLPSTPRLTVRR